MLMTQLFLPFTSRSAAATNLVLLRVTPKRILSIQTSLLSSLSSTLGWLFASNLVLSRCQSKIA